MSKKSSIGPTLSGQETAGGIVYLAFQFLALPDLLRWCNLRFSLQLNTAELNFVFYLINFLAVLLIFHDFFSTSLHHALRRPIEVCQAVILGFVAYWACSWLTEWLVGLLVPGFSNYNDSAIAAMSRGNYFLMFLGTVILVPPAEEAMFRGLIFRNLYPKSHWGAYALSILAFTAIHVLGYIGTYGPAELLMAILQYLPAGLCLAWSYAKADSIFAPILIHAAINYLAIRQLR